jgi:hypothetical protein
MISGVIVVCSVELMCYGYAVNSVKLVKLKLKPPIMFVILVIDCLAKL